MMQSRRSFLRGSGGALLLPLLGVGRLRGQTVQSFSGPMEEDAYKPVRLAAKPGARASMTDARRDELEHSLKCQCGCPLDVYTCRTTDFSCSVSPQMHQDVMSLVGGGYSPAEILAAFKSVYGERVLMAPVKSGFNWLGWDLPFITLAAGAVLIAGLIRRWRRNAAPAHLIPADGPEPTAEELERIASAVRTES